MFVSKRLYVAFPYISGSTKRLGGQVRQVDLEVSPFNYHTKGGLLYNAKPRTPIMIGLSIELGEF